MSGFASSSASSASFQTPDRGGSGSASASPGGVGSPGSLGEQDGSFVFEDSDTIDSWTTQWLAANNVLNPTQPAADYMQAIFQFGKQKYAEYMISVLPEQNEAGLAVGELLRQYVLTSMLFEQQQAQFATDFVGVVRRRIVELALAYGE